MSWALVTGVAPCLSRLFGPALIGLRMLPGTTRTSRPCSSAKSAVIRAPLRSPASRMTVTSDKPEMMRLRRGKFTASGGMPGANSDTTAPASCSTIRVARPGVFGRIDLVEAVAHDGDRPPARLERCVVGGRVDALGKSADDRHAAPPGRAPGARQPRGRYAVTAPRADQGDSAGVGGEQPGRARTAPPAGRRPDAGWPG